MLSKFKNKKMKSKIILIRWSLRRMRKKKKYMNRRKL